MALMIASLWKYQNALHPVLGINIAVARMSQNGWDEGSLLLCAQRMD